MQPLVIGGGRVGTAISRMYTPPAPILRRGDRVPELPSPGAPPAPIWVCTTNDGLDAALAATPRARRRDLVFCQNGMLLPWLARNGLAGNTQVLLYMAAGADGRVTDGGLSLAHGGPWAAHVAAALAGGGVRCRAEPRWRAFQDAMGKKLLWACIFWAVCAALGETVGEVAARRAPEVQALVAELLPLVDDYVDGVSRAAGDAEGEAGSGMGESGGAGGCGSGEQGPGQGTAAAAAPPLWAGAAAAGGGAREDADRRRRRCEDVTAALIAYSLAIAAARPSREMALQEWRWRNGWLLGQAATPLHVEWLRRAGCGEQLMAQGPPE
ncbi:MAG: hypothetical protein J3K34DRAFT_287807 [Monoraphidium minutum]|nr:MAG: hypothetical protein J3K34DRAFT_287807 [Monoraphidium minutum]